MILKGPILFKLHLIDMNVSSVHVENGLSLLISLLCSGLVNILNFVLKHTMLETKTRSCFCPLPIMLKVQLKGRWNPSFYAGGCKQRVQNKSFF